MYGAAFLVFIIIRIILAVRAGEHHEQLNTRTVVVSFFRLGFGAAFVAASIEVPRAPRIGAAVLLLLPGAPIAIVTALGLPVLPFWLTRLLRPWSAGKENLAAAVFWELRARLRFGLLLSPKRVQKLADSLFSMSAAPAARGYTLAAQGMIDALQGNLDQVRALFNLTLDFRHNTYAVRRYCHAWLLAEAAERGQWTDVLRLARRGPFSMRRLLFRSCAEQLTRVRSHSRLRLRLLWLASPGRRQSLALVRACEQVTKIELPPLGRDFRAAFEGAARLAAAPAGTVDRPEIEEVAKLWHSALVEGSLRQHLVARMNEQASGFDVEQALASLETQIVSLLADSLAQASSESGASGGAALDELDPDRPLMLMAAEARLQGELFTELEMLSAVVETDDAARNADLEAVVRRWAEIRWTAQRYLDLFPGSRALFYDNFGPALLNHGAWLHNQVKAYPLACDVFRWLRDCAPADHDDLKLLRGNEKLSYGAAKLQ
jgi:hypothetical protein